MKAGDDTLQWLRAYYAALDELRFDEVAEFLDEHCRNQYPDGTVVVGRDRILKGMRAALGALAGIGHELQQVWEEEDEVIFELKVTYRLRDQREIVRPGVGILERRRGRITAQRLFVDASDVWS